MEKYFKSCIYDYQVIKENDKPLKRPKQNVIWIMADQLRAQAISCNKDPNVRTPNIDDLSVNGVNFTQAVSTYPLCCPFRATMLTGLDHKQCMTGHQYPIPYGVKTIADAFNENNYDTAYFGKWHVDGDRRNPMLHIVPKERRGRFKTWIGYENNNLQWNTFVHGHDKNGEIEQYKLKGYETDKLTNLLLDYLETKTGDDPFFAVLSVQPPHSPHSSPAKNHKHYNWSDIKLRPNVAPGEENQSSAKLELSRYYSMIENLDDNVGRITKKLLDLDLDENTTIIFFSDHGDMMKSQGLNGKVVPFEESIRIPFIIGGVTGGAYGYKTGETDALINDHDIAATTLGLCDIKQPEWLGGYDYSHYRFMEGSDCLTFPQSQEDEPEAAFIKAIIPREGCDKAWRGVVTRAGWKYVCFEGMEWLMFNLNKDPYEMENLVHQAKYKEKRFYLLSLLRNWINENNDSFILPEEEYL